MIQIIPSILVPDAVTFKRQYVSLDGVVDLAQLDVADGEFVSQTTWADPDVVKGLADIDVDIELHLMVAHPLIEIEKWIDVPQIVKVLTPFEAKDDLTRIIEAVHGNGWDVSIVLNPETDVTVLEPYLDDIDGVMFMGVNPGEQGQSYLTATSKKIFEFVSEDSGLFVELDGGVNLKTLPEIIPSGLDAVCPGSAIFGNGQSAKYNVERMRETIHRLTQ